jgi:toxin ParE1/3/4
VTFIHEIREHCQILSTSPKAAPKRDDLGEGIRMAIHGKYLMFYRTFNHEIRIERILHGARDIMALFGEG